MRLPRRLSRWAILWARWAILWARVWATHWVLIIGGCLVLGSVILKWVEFPFTRNLSGLRLPLVSEVGLVPHLHLLSCGAVGIALLVTGFFLRRFFGPSLALATAVAITLWIVVPAQIAFEQPTLLRRLIEEDQDVSLIQVFKKTYLPQNYGPAEDIPKHPNLYTVWGRFVAGLSFLRIGWYCFGVGWLLITIYSIRRLTDERAMTGITLVCLPVGVLAVILARPAVAQYYFTKASIAEARGSNAEAIAGYRKAMSWDSWHAENIEIYAAIGQLEKLAGYAHDSPERHIAKAKELKEANEYESAIFEFSKAAEGQGALAAAARREAARTRVDLGLALYRAGGIGGAVTNWQEALTEDPSLVYALPYLARGYYDLSRYEAALEVVNRLIKIEADHDSGLADAYSLGGDSYAKLGRDNDARRYYNLSITIDPIVNHWALTGLVGE